MVGSIEINRGITRAKKHCPENRVASANRSESESAWSHGMHSSENTCVF